MITSKHLKTCIDACNKCVTACEHCAASCLREPDINMMVRCIELDRDCADMCRLAVQLMSRGSAYAARFCARWQRFVRRVVMNVPSTKRSIVSSAPRSVMRAHKNAGTWRRPSRAGERQSALSLLSN